MIRKVTFYWILVTLMLLDSWLLSKPNILGKIGIIIYKYHYLRSFPRTLLTVWTVVSISILIVFLFQYLLNHLKLSRGVATFVLGACLCVSLLMGIKVYIDFTSWTYSHTGLKFRIGAYLLPMILMMVFGNGLIQLRRPRSEGVPLINPVQEFVPHEEVSAPVSHDTSQP